MLKTIKKAIKRWMNRKEIKALEDEQAHMELKVRKGHLLRITGMM